MFVRCKYLDPEGYIQCNIELNDCDKCTFQHPELNKDDKQNSDIKKENIDFLIPLIMLAVGTLIIFILL